MSPDEPTSDDPKNRKRASPLQAELTGLSEANDTFGVLARWAAGVWAARIMAVIAVSRVLRDVTLGPFKVWVRAQVLVQFVGPGSEDNAMSLWEGSEIASEAVSLYDGRLSHWPCKVVV